MKACLRKMMMVAVAATMSVSSFAGVVELELEDGGAGASRELIFVAKTVKQAILKIAQPGLAEETADGTLDDGSDIQHGFAFGQSDGGSDPLAWENYAIDTISPESDVETEICSGTAAADDEHISKATGTETYVATGNSESYTLDGSCEVTGLDHEVTASVKLAYEVVASGGAGITVSVDNLNGVDSDGTANSTKDFETFSMDATEGHDLSATSVSFRDFSGLGEDLVHGDSGVLAYSIAFDAGGSDAKEESRASSLITAGVTP
jgi:hypothetical protein